MKKITTLLCITVLLCSICACGNSAIADSAPATTASSQSVDEYESDISALQQLLPSDASVSITNRDGTIDVSIFYYCSPITQKSYAAMGKGIYDSKLYCDSAFDTYELAFSLFDSDDSSIQLLWVSSIGEWGIGEWGTMIDKRSGEAETTVYDSLDDLCRFFPTLSKDIKASKLDQQDTVIYNEVMSALNERPNDSEEVIFEELAPKYSMTSQQLYVFMKDFMGKVYSKSTDVDPKTPLVYPAFSESSHFDWFPMAPEIVYSTPASENGLGDNIYSFIGTVKEFGSLESYGTELRYFILETEKGPVLFCDEYGWAIAHYPEWIEQYEEPDSDYTFPVQSDYVKVYGIYMGYSDVFDMPSCIYGCPKYSLRDK